nr:uncharacterized mitochondrial protein AtMg00810-like [Tanacetum cinerariifolium]
MFEEYFNPPSNAASLVPVVAAPRAVEIAGSPSSITIDQDAPSSTNQQQQSSVILQGVEEPIPNALFDDPCHEPLHAVSTSQELSSNMSMMGKMSFFLGLQISQSPRVIFINQSKYAYEIIKKYGMLTSDSVDTPMVKKNTLDANLPMNQVDATHYRGMIGFLMYLTSSRPNLIYAVCLYVRYQAKHTKKHLNAVKRIFRYLKGTINMGLWYSKDTGMSLTAYSDADHAGCQDTRRGTSGSAQFLASYKEKPRIKSHWMLLNSLYAILLFGSLLKFLKYICINSGTPLRSSKIQFCPRLPNQYIIEPPSEEEMVPFIKELGYTGKCDMLSEIHTDHMHQPWRIFAAVINRCIFRKSKGLDRLKPSRAQILWGMFYQNNVDYVALLWEDFMFQVDNREMSSSRKENMPYPKFTKVIINHFISKDKTVSMRNQINLYTVLDDTLLGAATPKKVRKFKKLASPSKKQTLVLEDEPAKNSKWAEKSAPAKEDVSSKIPQERSQLVLSSETLLKSTGVVIRDTPGVPNVPKGQSESKSESWGDSRDDDDDNYDDINDDDNDDGGNNVENDVTEEEYVRINEELYGDVNVSLKDNEHADKEKGNVEMTVAGQVNINQEGTCNQVKDQAKQKTEGLIPSFSISSDYAAKYLNFDNIPLDDTEIVSMLDIYVQHEVPRTSPLLTISVYVILERTIVKPPEIVKIASITNLEKDVKELKTVDHSALLLLTIKSKVPNDVKEYLGTSLDDALHKVLQKHSADIIKEHSVLAEFVERLKQQYIPGKNTEDIIKIKMKHARKQQEPKETITSSDTIALTEFDQKTTLFKTMTKSKSFNKSTKPRALYHALMESILEDEDAMNEGVTNKLKKRKQDDADKDEGPSARSDRGLKRQKTSKDTEPPKKAKSTESSGTSKGTSKSQLKSTDTPKHDLFKTSERPQTLDSDWDVRKSIDFRPPQTWISKIAQAEKPLLSFDELMRTPIDFSAYDMNHLKIDKLTQEHLVGTTFNLLKGTCKSRVELEYNFKECYKALNDRLDLNNPEGKECPFDLSKSLPLIIVQGRQVIPVDYFIKNDLEYLRRGSSSKKYRLPQQKQRLLRNFTLCPKRQWFYGFASNKVSKYDVYSTKRIIAVTRVKVMKWYDYGYLEEIEVQKEDQQLYKTKEGYFLRLYLHDIKDMLLLLVQKKLSNLEREVIFDLGVALRMFTRRIVILKRVEDLQLGVESYQKKINITKPQTFKLDISNRTPYTTYNNPQGIIYVDKYNKNRLMRSDELYKFSDETLTSVRTILHDIALNPMMDYLPKRRWSNLDRQRSRIMIKAIDKLLLERRLMMSLEKFVSGKDYGEDFRLLQRTI